MKMPLVTRALSLQIGTTHVCDNLNWQINSGEIWGILGPNGCGKTSLLHALAGLRKVALGEIFLFGDSLNLLSQKSIAKRLGILLQEVQSVFPETVQNYCLAGRHPHLGRFSRENARDLEIVAHMLDMVELSKLRAQNVLTLSGGEQRRLGIATLLAQQPSVYLLDEPTNHLDLRHQIKVLNHFKQIAKTQGCAVVMTTHDINLAQHYCDKILMMMGEGEILQGTADEMLTAQMVSRLYQHEVVSVQFEGRHVWSPVFLDRQR